MKRTMTIHDTTKIWCVRIILRELLNQWAKAPKKNGMQLCSERRTYSWYSEEKSSNDIHLKLKWDEQKKSRNLMLYIHWFSVHTFISFRIASMSYYLWYDLSAFDLYRVFRLNKIAIIATANYLHLKMLACCKGWC